MNIKKANFTWVLVLLVVAAVIGTAYIVIAPQLVEKTRIRIADGIYNAAVLKDEASINQAMDKSSNLKSDDGELYIYDEVGVWPIYVSGESSRDYIWVSADYRIVYSLENLSPDKEPHKQYMPKARAKYVIALPAGSVKSKSITQNKTIKFEQDFIDKLNKTSQQ